jgi:hypothetical protein
MRASILIAIAGAASLTVAGAAFAQDANATAGDTAVNPPAAAPADATAPPAGGYASSDTLGDTSKMKAGDPDVVSNGPIPDTRENRTKYGRPDSHAGRATKATGD